jgi:hypothetical protein
LLIPVDWGAFTIRFFSVKDPMLPGEQRLGNSLDMAGLRIRDLGFPHQASPVGNRYQDLSIEEAVFGKALKSGFFPGRISGNTYRDPPAFPR